MRLPDWLVIGAQKSGTTSLFLLLSKNPQLFLPSQKELQFFSSDELYIRGLEWYSQQHFSDCPSNILAGEVSPQYMYSSREASRIHSDMPNVKLIAILREPIDRAYSQYLMAVRRGQEARSLTEAFNASYLINEKDKESPESVRYFQFSDYESVLSSYLEFFGREKILVLFQEDLASDPEAVLMRISKFLDIDYKKPDNLHVRVHRSGKIRFKFIDKLVKTNSLLHSTLRTLIPRRFRSTLVFWSEILNVKPVQVDSVPADIRAKYKPFAKRQVAFIHSSFGLKAPWKINSTGESDN